MANEIKQLKENNENFYPVTVGQAIMYSDQSTAEVTESEMDEIFDWHRQTSN